MFLTVHLTDNLQQAWLDPKRTLTEVRPGRLRQTRRGDSSSGQRDPLAAPPGRAAGAVDGSRSVSTSLGRRPIADSDEVGEHDRTPREPSLTLTTAVTRTSSTAVTWIARGSGNLPVSRHLRVGPIDCGTVLVTTRSRPKVLVVFRVNIRNSSLSLSGRGRPHPTRSLQGLPTSRHFKSLINIVVTTACWHTARSLSRSGQCKTDNQSTISLRLSESAAPAAQRHRAESMRSLSQALLVTRAINVHRKLLSSATTEKAA